VQDPVGVGMPAKDVANTAVVADVGFGKLKVALSPQPRYVRSGAGTGQVVDDDDFVARVEIAACGIGPNEPSSTGDQYFHSSSIEA
jgi:hypothetical protein